MSEYSGPRELLPLTELEFSASAALVEPRLAGNERLRDVMSGAAYLARRRCVWLNKPAEVADLAFALSVFDWWPTKPELAKATRETIVQLRARAFERAHVNVHRMDPHPLQWLVPVRTLVMGWPELFEEQARGVEAFLEPGGRPGPSWQGISDTVDRLVRASGLGKPGLRPAAETP